MSEFKPTIMRTAGLRFAPAPMLSTRAADDRVIDFVFSDESVARDGHTISTSGWQLENYLTNPVFLWAHDGNSPPIGRVVRIGAEGGNLTGSVQFASAEEYDFADTIFRLYKSGFLNAASVSWNPLDWRHTTDKRRPGGIDFLRQELLEVSAVPVPALATALVTARAAGIDTKPLFDWAERALDLGGFAVVPRSELETLRREAKMPAAPRAKEADLPVVEAPPIVPEAAADAPPRPKLSKRSLSHVGWLAMLLNDLGSLQKGTEWEAAIEEDGSPVPGQLLDALKSLGAVLVAMTAEEVSELLAGDDEDDDFAGGIIAYASDLDLRRDTFRALRRLPVQALAAVNLAMRMQISGRAVTFTDGGTALPLVRAGAVLSAENARCLRTAHDNIRSVLARHEQSGNDSEDCDPDDPDCDCDPEVDDDCERALRARKAAARRKKLAIAPA